MLAVIYALGVSCLVLVTESIKQVCTSAANVALPAFATARRAAVDRYILPAGPTAANPLLQRANGTD